jgi:hypothetical protein
MVAEVNTGNFPDERPNIGGAWETIYFHMLAVNACNMISSKWEFFGARTSWKG